MNNSVMRQVPTKALASNSLLLRGAGYDSALLFLQYKAWLPPVHASISKQSHWGYRTFWGKAMRSVA